MQAFSRNDEPNDTEDEEDEEDEEDAVAEDEELQAGTEENNEREENETALGPCSNLENG